MKPRDEIRSLIEQRQNILAGRYGVEIVGLFGSHARQDPKPGSDIDLLSEILPPASLFELIGAETYLSQVLGAKVDPIPTPAARQARGAQSPHHGCEGDSRRRSLEP